MNGPDFLIIGAARSGTSSLFELLRRHSAVFMPENKEPHYFLFGKEPLPFSGPGDVFVCKRYTTTLPHYLQLFQKAKAGQLKGEASPYYLTHPPTAERIYHQIPHIKLIVLLRNPADRAYSSYGLLRLQGRELLKDFPTALEQEEARISSGWEWIWHYRSLGFYARQLQPYYDIFPKKHILPILFEDFIRSPLTSLKQVETFLNLPHHTHPLATTSWNPSGIARFAFLNRLASSHSSLSFLGKCLPAGVRNQVRTIIFNTNIRKQKPLHPEIRKSLLDCYREDRQNLEKMTGIDTRIWDQSPVGIQTP
jgi:hypothetical protein